MGAPGHCPCGKVTYELSGEPIATAVYTAATANARAAERSPVNVIACRTSSRSGELGTYVETGENDDGEVRPSTLLPVLRFADRVGDAPGRHRRVKAGTLGRHLPHPTRRRGVVHRPPAVGRAGGDPDVDGARG